MNNRHCLPTKSGAGFQRWCVADFQVGTLLWRTDRAALETGDTVRRGTAATKHSLSSMQWRRGTGRGGSLLAIKWAAPLLGPLPAPAWWGEEDEKSARKNRRGSRRFREL